MAKKKQKTNKKNTKTIKSSKGQLYSKISSANISKHALPEHNVRISSPENASLYTTAENIRLKSGFNKLDKQRQNSGCTIPTEHQDIVAMTQAIYKKMGLIRNIIDLMADFSSEGLNIKHPVKKQQRFYRSWAKRVDLQGRAHDFMKLLLRDANVIVRRRNAELPPEIIKLMSSKSSIKAEKLLQIVTDEKPEKVKVDDRKDKSEIPWRYTFLNPVMIEKVGGAAAKFFNGNDLAMRIPKELANSIRNPKTDIEKDLQNKLPQEVIDAVKKTRGGGGSLILLDPTKIYIDYYKKDDWEDWGTPFLYGIFDEITLKEKMKLADMSALDGVINTIRLWRLGDHKEKILPNPNAVNKLLDILQHNQGGGVLDLVWDSMIDLKTEYPPVDKILGDEKYTSVNRDIVQGLGIPNALLGGVDLATRNAETAFVQLKTLIERLEYIREKCLTWINGEFKRVADAMGFKTTPFVSFGTMSLRNEAAEKQLMIQLVDRGIVSVEAVHELFGTNFVIELQRIRDEQNIRDAEPNILEKGNPYFRPLSILQLQHEFQLELNKLKSGDNPNGDQPNDEGDNSSGRPPNTVDTNPRDKKTQPVLSVYKTLAENYMKKIDKIIDPLYVKSKNIKNIRFLTKEQSVELEKVKRHILATITLKDNIRSISKEDIFSRTSNDGDVPRACIFEKIFSKNVLRYIEFTGSDPRLEERKSLASSTWATFVSITD